MNTMLINKKTVRSNKAMRAAQKVAKKRYGRARGIAPKLRISKVVALKSEAVMSFFTSGSNATKVYEDAEWKITGQELIAELIEEELKGLSGGGFSTAQKMETFMNAKEVPKYLIINAVECEPGLLHDEWILTHCYEEVKKGIAILKTCFDFKKAYLASKISNPGIGSEICYAQMPNRYPMGQEMLLIGSLLGIELSNSDIPAEKGILVLNIQTVLAIGRIVGDAANKNVRYLTVANLMDTTATVVEAPMGMKAMEIAKKVFPHNGNIYIGGGIMNAHLLSEADVIDASTCMLACGDAVIFSDAKCKGCGGCTANCPGGVDVRGIIRAMEKGKTEGFEQFHPEKCIGCGACSYVCHAGKNVSKMIAHINGKDE